MWKKLVVATVGIILMLGCDGRNSGNSNSSESTIPDGGLYAPNIMVNDKYYHTTGLESDDEHSVDGAIESSVDQSMMPEKNNQANFGEGFEYDIINDKRIDVYINGKWIKFEQWEGDSQ